MNNKKTVLFDLDGTITDSKMGITKSAQYALAQYGIKVDNLDELEKFIGPPLADSFKEFYGFSNEKAIEAVEHYRVYYKEKGLYDNILYPMVEDMLIELKACGKTLVIATSKPTVFAKKILDHYDISKYFVDIVGSNLDGTRNAKDEVIMHALSNLDDVKLDSVVMIGDREHDLIGAQKNNIEAIGVTYGFGSYDELKEHNPAYIVNSVDELMKILR